MAVVFISPKQRQKMFFMGIAGTLVVFLTIVTLLVFLSKPKMVSTTQVFQKPEISIDFAVLDAEQVKNSDILNLDLSHMSKISNFAFPLVFQDEEKFN